MLKIETTLTSELESRHIVFLDDEGSTFHMRVLILANDCFERILQIVLTQTKFFGFDFF